MGFARRTPGGATSGQDAVWARGWTADTFSDLASISAIGVGGPCRGDWAYVTASGLYYLWLDNGSWAQVTGLVVTPSALTKVDDTNVTLTLGGSPSTALLAAASITAGWTGTLAAGRLNSNVVQAVANDTNVTGSVAAQTLTLGWTGTAAVARGGTGSGTAAGARTNLGVAIGSNVEAWSANLDALAALTGTGLLAQTGANAFAERTITAGSSKLSVSNGNGVSGNPTLDVVPGNIALSGLSGFTLGTWTPTVGGSTSQSGQTYTIQDGTYIKLDHLVIAWYTITLSALGTITGNAQVQGLPFTSFNDSTYRSSNAVFWNATTTAFVLVQGLVVGNTTAMALRGTAAATTGLTTNLVQGDLSSTTTLAGTVVYRSDT